MLSRRAREDRSVYKAIERALWAFAPVPALMLMLSYPSMEAARQQAEAETSAAAAAENHEFCIKWGMPEGTAEHLICVRDLVGIRARAEQRVRDQIAAADLF